MRLFVAVELDEPAREFLQRAQRLLAGFDALVRWARCEQMHLTLKFLGNVPDDGVVAACDAVRRAVAGLPPFEMTLGGFGCFPESGRARVLWSRIDEPSGTLLTAQRRLDEEFFPLGFAPEKRAYTPHITLGRIRADTSRGALRGAVADLPAGSVVQPVSEIVMMQSVLMRSGAVYTPVARCSLGQRAAAPSLRQKGSQSHDS
ncbi:MAG TPA: RNA 2',3'-cyclic phosphodiesterase [Phycisphaerae bacterium]